MPGLFEDIGEFFTGDKKRAQEAQQAELGRIQQEQQAQLMGGAQKSLEGVAGSAKALDTQAKAAGKQGAAYAGQTAADMGTGAADYMRKANEAASAQAGQSATAGSIAAARNALKTARTAGLNRGQAALAGGQQAGDVYGNMYQQGLESGRNQYGQNVAQRSAMSQADLQRQSQNTQAAGNLRSTAAGQQLAAGSGAASNAININQAQGQNAQNAAIAGGGTTSGLLQAAGSLLSSDENVKTDIELSGDRLIDSLLAKGSQPRGQDRIAEVAAMTPVDFNYKPESGEDPSKRNVGVLAQELERTSMGDNVVDTPKGKMVDVDKQSLSNLNLIIQLAGEVMRLRDEIASTKGV